MRALKLSSMATFLACCATTQAFSTSLSTPSRGKIVLSMAIPPRFDESSAMKLSSRRQVLSFASSSAAFLLAASPAIAKYGDSSNMELPSYIDYLIEKNSQGDASKSLYQGADPKVQLQRLVEANQRLGEVSTLAASKKWSQIQGLVTGPLGTLAQNLNAIVTASGNDANVTAQSKKVKATVIAIGQAASKKDGDKCTELAQQASKELQNFVQLAFE